MGCVRFVDFDELPEVLDSIAGKGRHVLFSAAVDTYDAVLRLHIDADVMQQVFVLAQQFG